jgi:predicted RNA methylase
MIPWRRRVPERRGRLADDVRRLAGWSHLIVAEARRLGAEVPDGVTACSLVWSHWADRLTAWAKGDRS